MFLRCSRWIAVIQSDHYPLWMTNFFNTQFLHLRIKAIHITRNLIHAGKIRNDHCVLIGNNIFTNMLRKNLFDNRFSHKLLPFQNYILH